MTSPDTNTDNWAARYPAEAADPHCLDPGRMRRLLAPAPWKRIVALGDSVAAGVRQPTLGYENLGGFDKVARALPGDWYANFGERGRLTHEVVRTQLPRALDLDPDLALIAVGGNDALSPAFDPDAVHRDLSGLIAALVASGVDVAVIGLFDLARSGLLPAHVVEPMAARFDALDDITRRAAVEQNAIFVDNHTHPAARDPRIFADDLMHCNARGHAISAATLTLALASAMVTATLPARDRSGARS